ncbi:MULTISPECIES: 2Fe-2S iron-sulfur cluster-binding protein [Desulfococcus]|uniref:4Fe-4S ferredoxin, iron-sulpur binding domain-containing protein n=1 Tax=Desulfococcus multivorans DSM 2059 TaxID=1121405 RepID=S7VAJ2_DESML|nr:2Fe-2S iron-sulfur cluster-binding protein [Desulfococcus multivorans]AOY58615.1 NuoG2: predicted NADH quinone oxidoreductase, subunit G [Desulfococcus multivorans]AQV00914.1 (4Fe-4S)-binding protein [Desulfococcus multivorans]EPR41533.1 4Fe-4S ferredoxin, iron-sulpur binding domain-containing protein [Desulfococcus multivorans DSM 2059]MDX9818730.1 2Fe-2S iron-sulfur cluster-binding protein [Desulfococcus multivorans]SJZ44739.1 NADH-quinone oxidoreductase subunit G [Desulfococcus multivora
MVNIIVDNREISVEEGVPLLAACLENGIDIPNLCWMEGMGEPWAACRLCFVEIEGEKQPVTSCTVLTRSDMVVRTDTPAVRALQQSALALLLSVHHVDCKNCHANRKCALQDLARRLKVSLKPKHLENYLKPVERDETHPSLVYFPNRCVLCGKCIHVCRNLHGQPLISFARRGFDTIVSFQGDDTVFNAECTSCGACAAVCPVGALATKEMLNGL